MLDYDTRNAILRLHKEGHGARPISEALGVSRNAVKRVLRSGRVEVPKRTRVESAEPHLDRIRELFERCEGNLVRVQEELEAGGVPLRYSTLTGFCRRHGIGVSPKVPAGQYHFAPGEEMQHDTSPHEVVLGGRKRKVQCASLVLCYSRMIFAQVYPTFNRFLCKVFMTDGIVYFGGAAARCMIDNSSVIVAHGTGPNAVMAPEMDAFGQRFGFHFVAHRVGDANRSARVERPFHYIENNFYAGRTFADMNDLNAQLAAWCDRVNGTFRRHLHAKPTELFAAEAPRLRSLPLHVPEVYLLHERIVDVEGYVTLHRNRYSVPVSWISRRVEVRETKAEVRIFANGAPIAVHARREPGEEQRVTLPEHEHQRRWQSNASAAPPLPEEARLCASAPELAELVSALKKRHGGRAVRQIRVLHRMWLDYPIEPLRQAIAHALSYGLLDLLRIERMVLRSIAGDFFRLDPEPDDEPDHG